MYDYCYEVDNSSTENYFCFFQVTLKMGRWPHITPKHKQKPINMFFDKIYAIFVFDGNTPWRHYVVSKGRFLKGMVVKFIPGLHTRQFI